MAVSRLLHGLKSNVLKQSLTLRNANAEFSFVLERAALEGIGSARPISESYLGLKPEGANKRETAI